MPKNNSVALQNANCGLTSKKTPHHSLSILPQNHAYLTHERGLTGKTIIHFGLGYSTDYCARMGECIIIPIHNIEGRLIAHAGHLPSKSHNKDIPEYQYSDEFKTTHEVFNLHRALNEVTSKPLAIVNDFFDVMKLHQNDYRKVVALMGDTMSLEQEKLIHQSVNLHTRVLIMLNEDEVKLGKIVNRLSKFCYAKVYQFDGPEMRPENLTVAQIEGLF